MEYTPSSKHCHVSFYKVHHDSDDPRDSAEYPAYNPVFDLEYSNLGFKLVNLTDKFLVTLVEPLEFG